MKKMVTFVLYVPSIVLAIGIGMWQNTTSGLDGQGSLDCNVHNTNIVSCGPVTSCGNAVYSSWNTLYRPHRLHAIRGNSDMCVRIQNNVDTCGTYIGTTTLTDDCGGG